MFPQFTVLVLQLITNFKKEYEEKNSDMRKICTETN